jgi:hypothetical protein
MALEFTLESDCLDNVDDAAGRFQIEGGRVYREKAHVGNYSSVKRVSCGTEKQNTAQLWLTLFFFDEMPPQNMTLHGAHDFHSGSQIGSVSAASTSWAGNIGQQFSRVGNLLTIG